MLRLQTSLNDELTWKWDKTRESGEKKISMRQNLEKQQRGNLDEAELRKSTKKKAEWDRTQKGMREKNLKKNLKRNLEKNVERRSKKI